MKSSNNTHSAPYKSISQVLVTLYQHPEFNQTLTIGKLMDLLEHRAFGLGILIFSIPSVLPLSSIPGVAALFSLPILLLALQLIIIRKKPWLPHWLRNKKLNSDTLTRFLQNAIPYVQKAEKLIRPRYAFCRRPFVQPFIGITLVLLSILLMLPIPLSNMIFGSLIALIALGLIENDGLILLIGVTLSIITFFCYFQAITSLLLWLF